jgi:hypothetical protein
LLRLISMKAFLPQSRARTGFSYDNQQLLSATLD